MEGNDGGYMTCAKNQRFGKNDDFSKKIISI
jgi:hypothetical protein